MTAGTKLGDLADRLHDLVDDFISELEEEDVDLDDPTEAEDAGDRFASFVTMKLADFWKGNDSSPDDDA